MPKLHKNVFLLALIISGVIFLNYWWIRTDKGEMHRAESFKFFVADSYHSPNPNSVALDFYPPGYSFVPTVFCRFLHLDFRYDTCVLLNSIYFVLSLIGVFLIVRYLLKKDSYAALSCFVFMAFPLFLYTSKKFFMEVGLTPWVIFAVYLVLINENWANYRKAFLLGAISGIGMLFKWTFLLYVAGPFALSLLYSLNNKASQRKHVLTCFGLTIFVAAAICGLWYTLHFSFAELLFNFKAAWIDATNIQKSYWSFLKYNLWRSSRFVIRGISYPFMIASLLSVFVTFRGIKADKKIQILIAWFAFPFVVLWAFTGDCEPRYLLPILPFFAVILVVSLDKLGIRMQRYLVVIFVGLCLWNISYETFAYRPPRKIGERPLGPIIQTILLKTPDKRPLYIGFNGIYDSQNWDESFDAFVMFWAYKINDRLPFNMRYFKGLEDLKDIRYYDYIISQRTNVNNKLHREFLDKGYKKMFEFNHYYRENSDPLFNWECYPDYIVFKKTKTGY